MQPITKWGRDGDALEDVDEFFDKGIIKQQLELAVRMAEVARSTSEWQRRMTSEKLSQSGQKIDMNQLIIGSRAYIYKPPSQNDTKIRGRKAKHIDHYIGPGKIIKHIGKRSAVVVINDSNGKPREFLKGRRNDDTKETQT